MALLWSPPSRPSWVPRAPTPGAPAAFLAPEGSEQCLWGPCLASAPPPFPRPACPFAPARSGDGSSASAGMGAWGPSCFRCGAGDASDEGSGRASPAPWDPQSAQAWLHCGYFLRVSRFLFSYSPIPYSRVLAGLSLQDSTLADSLLRTLSADSLWRLSLLMSG